MLVQVKVPVLSESVADAKLLQWRRKAGEFVRRDETLIELETDKVVLEITAPDDGVLARILKSDGETATSGEIIAEIDTDAKASLQTVTTAATPQPPSAAPQPSEPATAADTDLKLSPAVRKLVSEHHLDPARIRGTGKDGRLTKHDILRHLERQAPAPSNDQPPVLEAGDDRPAKRVPMTRLRRRIAERLKEAQNTAAILTTFNEVNMAPVMALRKKYQERFVKEHGVKLGFMSFFTKAAIEALKKYPIINAAIDGEDIIYHGYFDIGVAVSSPRGLVVPIIRNADMLSFAELETAIVSFGEKAREGKLTIEELTGGTFTISNGGVFGSLLSTPILNPPQSAILGMHKIEQRPIVENGEIVIRPMMYLALSYDHRIIDGHEAVLFLVTIKEMLEDPARMLIQI